MNEQDEEFRLAIQRILVALDASHHSLAALEAAAELAASLGAELQGLFVEDINLLHVADLPGAQEVRYPFLTTTRLDRARMERQLRAQAVQARQALAAVCERKQVKWSFRVVRGEVAPEVLEAALDADLLSLGKASRPLTQRVRLGSTARAAAAQAPRSVLLIQRNVGIMPPVVVTYDGSPAAQRALMLATYLAWNTGGHLTVLIWAESSDDAEQLQAGASQWLRKQLHRLGLALRLRYKVLTDAGVATLTHAVQTEGSGVLVLSCNMLSSETLQGLLDQVDCPVLLVR